MTQFLVHVCDGRSDDEVATFIVEAEATAEEYKEVATNIARSTIENTIDRMTTVDSSVTYCMEEMAPARYVVTADGVALHNVRVRL